MAPVAPLTWLAARGRHGHAGEVLALICLAGLTAAPAVRAAPGVEHGTWDRLLKRYVEDGLVDYAGIGTERPALEQYLASLEDAAPASWSRAEQTAFWINAYNACVVRGVLDHRPIASVKRVKGFFTRPRCRVAGRERTLDALEAAGRKLEPMRIHFAVVCAAVSCPPIRDEAYVPERLEVQLTEQLQRFLVDREHGLRVEGSVLRVSKIFDWYEHDFVPGAGGWLRRLSAEQLIPVLLPYLAPEAAQAIRGRPFTLRFLPYDWSLNARRDE